MRRVGVSAGVAAGVIALVCAGVPGCSGSVSVHTGTAPPVVAKADLENDIANRLTEAKQTPQSVTCAEDLVGEVGKTTRCEVVLSETNAIEPIVTVTEGRGHHGRLRDDSRAVAGPTARSGRHADDTEPDGGRDGQL